MELLENQLFYVNIRDNSVTHIRFTSILSSKTAN